MPSYNKLKQEVFDIMNNDSQNRIEAFKEWYTEARPRYVQVGEYVLNRINTFLKEQKFNAAYSSTRAKTIDSAYQKAKKYVQKDEDFVLKYTDPKNEIMDFSGVRIVVYLPSELEIVTNAIERLFENSIKFDDSENKINRLGQDKVGYLSIHYVIEINTDLPEYANIKGLKCEIQVRTVLQDAWASIFHDRVYKGVVEDQKDNISRKINLLSGSLELLDSQIDAIVSYIDKQNGKFDLKAYQSLLDEEISEDSLMRYCGLLLYGRVERFYSYEKTLDLLEKFGVNKIRDLEYHINAGFIQQLLATDIILTVDKFIRYSLVISDYNKLFSCIGETSVFFVDEKIYNLLNKYVSMDLICEKYSLKKSDNIEGD